MAVHLHSDFRSEVLIGVDDGLEEVFSDISKPWTRIDCNLVKLQFVFLEEAEGPVLDYRHLDVNLRGLGEIRHYTLQRRFQNLLYRIPLTMPQIEYNLLCDYWERNRGERYFRVVIWWAR